MKILIAEDNPMWAKLLEQNTQQWKFKPVVVSDGKQALDQLHASDEVRLAVLDWQMPEVSGVEICRKIKNDPQRPFTYVVLLTSRDSKEDIVTGLDAGADDYLTKPVDMAVLRSRLGAARRIIEAIPPQDWSRPRIEGYEVKGVLGKGAFATVYEAVRVRDEKPVAVKVLRVDLATDTVFERFAREVEVMQGLDHPYIAKIYDSRVDRRVGYYAMDLITGGTLYDYEKRETPSGIQRIRMIQWVCEGLHHAHQQGVIHRDLKFSNIMVTQEGRPKIVDFGMSKSLFAPTETELLKTIEGSVLGTPLFMAPEQARGEIGRMDGRTDLYAAATVLYIFLLRRHPHAIDTSDRTQTLEAIAHGEARHPSEFKPDFNPRLEAILMKALEHRPEDRYDTTQDFADALAEFIASKKGG